MFKQSIRRTIQRAYISNPFTQGHLYLSNIQNITGHVYNAQESNTDIYIDDAETHIVKPFVCSLIFEINSSS